MGAPGAVNDGVQSGRHIFLNIMGLLGLSRPNSLPVMGKNGMNWDGLFPFTVIPPLSALIALILRDTLPVPYMFSSEKALLGLSRPNFWPATARPETLLDIP